jgi:WD40 repeat protein
MEHTQDVKALAWHPKEDVSFLPISFVSQGRSSFVVVVQIVASASYDDTINLYMDDPDDDWFPYITLKGHESTVWSVVFSPCGGYLASASDDLSIKIWMRERVPKSHGAPGGTEERWSCQQTIANAHERTIYSLSWTSALAAIEDKGNEIGWIASVGGDGKLNVWRIQVRYSQVFESIGCPNPALPTLGFRSIIFKGKDN